MTIDEAIKWLERMKESIIPSWGTMGRDSIQLGIEALKFKKRFMKGAFVPTNYLLPGETEK